MKTIAHIVNPVAVGDESDLFVAQPITFETMRLARELVDGRVQVSLYSAQYTEDREWVPEWMVPTPDLERSILDLGDFQVQRKLPLLRDILDRLYEATDADYLIYTNVDIALMPNFYLSVEQLIEEGHDAMVITRRTITNSYRLLDQIPLMYAEAGQPHPGYDCFIFRRSAYPEYYLGDVCVGVAFVGKALMMNLMCRGERFQLFRDQHLTFHLGNDKRWYSAALRDYLRHNELQLHNVLRRNGAEDRFSEHPVFSRHFRDMRKGWLVADEWPVRGDIGHRARRWLRRNLG